MFITLTKELCKVTTVAKYKILKSREDEVAKLYPEIVNWINWWHERQSHIFPPFRGGSLPGVNLSEQGNAGWKKWPMSLVRAAKEDFATMVYKKGRWVQTLACVKAVVKKIPKSRENTLTIWYSGKKA